MESESDAAALEERVSSLLSHLQTEAGILDRLVYKNKNQHRRCPYFQSLLKVRRDLKLLQSAELGEILRVLIPIIEGKKPAHKAFLLKRQKKNVPSGKYNFQERLLGVARLLSQMTEPILKAAIQISLLLAKSFFFGFSLTTYALLARLRVLVQQTLLNVVVVFNKVSSLSQKKHAVQLTQGFIEAFREYYPSSRDAPTLECVWEKDKFVLLEKKISSDSENQNKDEGGLPMEAPIKYETVQLFSEEEAPIFSMNNESHPAEMQLTATSTEDQLAVTFACTTAAESQRPLCAEPPLEEKLVINEGSIVNQEPSSKRNNKVAFVPVRMSGSSEREAGLPSKRMKLDLVVASDLNAEGSE